MKCQKCARPSVVHLTEIVTHTDEKGTTKRAMEIHLCLSHAVEAGLLIPASKPAPVPTKAAAPAASPPAQPGSGSIVPAKRKAAPLAVPPKPAPAVEIPACPSCGLTWAEFKKGGLMGCTHDYEQFLASLMPLIKRAHEGAVDHVGKVPPRRSSDEQSRRRALERLRRDLEKAIHLENYETAARLRDQLRQLERV